MQESNMKHHDTRMAGSKAASNAADQIDSNRKSGNINEGIRQIREDESHAQSRIERQLTPGAADTNMTGADAPDSRRNTERIIATEAVPRRRASDPLLDIDNDDLAAVKRSRRGSGHSREEDEVDKGIVGVDVDQPHSDGVVATEDNHELNPE